MPTTPPTITTSPAVPDPSNRATFKTRAYPWTIWMRDVAAEIAAVATNCYNNAVEAAASAVAALASQTSASLHASSAASFSAATMWVSGTTYTAGVAVISPINFLTYRRRSTGAGTTDPSLDLANYAVLSLLQALPVSSISTNTSAQVGIDYRMTASLVLTLPAAPAINAYLKFTNNSGTVTASIARNGKLIQGLAEDMVIDRLNASNGLVFTGDTFGWKLD